MLFRSIYFSVRNNAAKDVAVVVVDSKGSASRLDLAGLPAVRVTLPKSEAGPIRNISDLAFAGDRVLVTGQSNEEFSSKIFSIPIPLNSDTPGSIYSAETYHVSHKRWETKAPIQSFVPYDDHGKLCVVGAFACGVLVGAVLFWSEQRRVRRRQLVTAGQLPTRKKASWWW